MEVKAVLGSLKERPRLLSVIAGLGGRGVTPDDISGMIEYAMSEDLSEPRTLYWGLKE